MAETTTIHDKQVWTIRCTDKESRPIISSVLMVMPAEGPEEFIQFSDDIAHGVYKLYWKQDKMREAVYRRVEEVPT